MIHKNALSEGAELIIMAGDIAGCFSQQRTAELMADLPAPVLAVRGNSDRRKAEETFWRRPQVSSLHFNKVEIDGICFAGISGTVPLPFESRLHLREKQLLAKALSFFQGVDVLVAHPPPRGTLDQVFGRFSAGSPALRKLALSCRPDVLICGHIHENTGTAFLDETLVVNCSVGRTGGGALIDYSPGHPAKVRFL